MTYKPLNLRQNSFFGFLYIFLSTCNLFAAAVRNKERKEGKSGSYLDLGLLMESLLPLASLFFLLVSFIRDINFHTESIAKSVDT